MNHHVLALRVSRRAVAVALLDGEQLSLIDGRHLTSQPDLSVAAAERWVTSWLQFSGASRLVVDASSDAEGTTSCRVLNAIHRLAAERSVAITRVNRSDLLTSYGSPALRNRKELRALIKDFYANLQAVKGGVRPYVLDASALALYADCQFAINPPPS